MSDDIESPPEPGRIAYNVWRSIDQTAKTIPTLHEIDGEYPIMSARDARKDLEQAQRSIETAIERLEEVEAYHETEEHE